MRNVRPSWVRVKVDPSSNDPKPANVGKGGTGPRGRSGSLSVEILARIQGSAVPVLEIDVIGSADGESSEITVRALGTGAVVYSAKVTQ